MTLVISKVFTYDDDAATYIQAVEAADAQALEPATRKAINNFVLGCKADGIWTAIKASCILAGARTLNGALVPLVGPAPTKVGTDAGWSYNRKTGLAGNGSNNYLDSGYDNSQASQNNRHAAVYATAKSTVINSTIIGTTGSVAGRARIRLASSTDISASCGNSTETTVTNGYTAGTNLFATRRYSSTFFEIYAQGNLTSVTSTSGPPGTGAIGVLGNVTAFTNARATFYSIGDSLDFLLLERRASDLVSAFAAAIP